MKKQNNTGLNLKYTPHHLHNFRQITLAYFVVYNKITHILCLKSQNSTFIMKKQIRYQSIGLRHSSQAQLRKFPLSEKIFKELNVKVREGTVVDTKEQ